MAALVLVFAQTVRGCIYDCHTTPPCANTTITNEWLFSGTAFSHMIQASGANITSLAPNAFGCTEFEGATGINLNGNALTVLPDGAIFQNFTYILLQQNSISTLAANAFMSYARENARVFVDLSVNYLTTMSEQVFGGIGNGTM